MWRIARPFGRWNSDELCKNNEQKKKRPHGAFFTEEEGLEPPSLTAAVFKTADLPISLFLQRAGKE